MGNDFTYIKTKNRKNNTTIIMADYIFLRYGNQPNPQVTAALHPIVKRGTNVPFTALPGVMITGFTSDLSEAEIKQKLSHLNIQYDLVKKSGSTGSTSTPAAAPDANRTKTKAEFQAEIQAALDVEDYEKATSLRNDMNAAYPPADDTAESMITNIAEFRAVYESAIPTNESTDALKDERKKEILSDLREWSGGYDPTELPWTGDDNSLNNFMDNYVGDDEMTLVTKWFEELIDGNDHISNY